ncbi:MAG: sporulation protein YunB [Eubacteriales bacterium]|nr:sporulation protein YunB [Eubacteriales bacterium]
MALRKKILKLTVFFIFFVILAFTIMFALNFDAAAEQYAEYNVKNTIIEGINRIYYNNTKKYYGELKNAVTVNYAGDGKINSISVDSAFLNLMSSEIVTDSIMFIESSSSSFGIPLGNITSVRLLSGHGPKIGIKIIPLGSVSGGIQSSFNEAGINQTIHRITFEINVIIEVLTPFHTCRTEIRLSYVISETVIVGAIPNVYFK